MISQSITPLPAVPVRSDPVAFLAAASAYLLALPTFSTELGVWSGEANNTESYTTTLGALATASKTSAEASAAAAIGAAPATVWSAATAYPALALVIGEDGLSYRARVATTAGDNPVGSTTGAWVLLTADPAFAASLVFGGGIYPGWDMALLDSDGVAVAPDPAEPPLMVFSRGTERYRATFVWGSGATVGRIASALLEYSANSGANWAAVSPKPYLLPVYDSIGRATSAAWSATP